MRLIVFVVTIFVMLGGEVFAQVVGRYQITAVEYGIIGRQVILLDTQTGETWVLAPEAIEGKATGHDAWYVLERKTTLPPSLPRSSPTAK
jgi:hypothetical protein